jgi:hypothetical protein
MNHVEMWAKDKPPIIALLAPQIAAFARELPEIYRNLKKHQPFNQKTDLPHLPSWYSLYRNHRKYCEPFTKMMLEASEFAGQLTTLGMAFNELSQRKEDIAVHTPTEDELLEGKLFLHNLKLLSFAELRSDFEDWGLDYQTTVVVQKYLTRFKMELSFVFLVFTPCFMLYKMSPAKLYRKARHGNVNAIDMLLRLDPLMLHDPSIGQQIQKIRLFGRQTTYQNLVEAPLKPFKAKITNSKIKTSMATLISMMAESIKQPLTSTEIKKLFDAVAKDADKRNEDSAIPRNSATFSKAIQRKRPTWQPLLNPDSKT